MTGKQFLTVFRTALGCHCFKSSLFGMTGDAIVGGSHPSLGATVGPRLTATSVIERVLGIVTSVYSHIAKGAVSSGGVFVTHDLSVLCL
jgi:hypothetical protein